MTVAPARVLLLAVGLLGATGCASLGLEHPPTAPRSLPTIASPSAVASPKARTSGDGAALTEAQAQAALITESDLGAPWSATRGAATWRDGMLKSTAVGPCQRLLDVLYTDELLGGPPRAAVGLDDADTGAQLRYQIGGRTPQDADRALAWLATMPRDCARFSARAGQDVTQDVQVFDAPLPEVGDARQGLRVVLRAQPPTGEPTVLTLDVAAVRVGEDSFALTNGGLGDVANEATQAAVQVGALRLADVRKQGRAQV